MWKTILGIIIVIAICVGAINQCATSCQSKKLEPIRYIEAVNDADFEKAHDILDLHYAEYLDQYRRNARYIDRKAKSYWSAAHHIYKAEMQYLLPLNDPDANNRLIYTLQSMNEIGVKPIEGKDYGYDDYPDVDAYAQFVGEYNSICDDMLEIALTYRNKEMAKKLLLLYKDDVVSNGSDGTHTYNLAKTSKEAAKRLFDEADF